MSYNSKYKGQEIEDMLDQIANGEIGGGASSSASYIFPFTTQDIIDATEQDIPYRLSEEQIAEILDAIETKKRILIKQYPDVEGYNVIDSIYKDDMIYVHFIDLFSSYPATSCDFAIDMSAMHVTDFRLGTIATESNLKTINGKSIVGEGNIRTPQNLTYVDSSAVSGTIQLLPNTCIYMVSPLRGALTIEPPSTLSVNNGELVECRICVRMPSSGAMPTITFNSVAIRWAGGTAPTFEADFTYEISLFYPSNARNIGAMGVCVGFK